MPRISVVIPTFDRKASLAACLRALAVGFPPDVETIVVDDGGAQDLTSVVAPFVDRLRLQLFKTSNRGPAAARNHGAAQASGDVLVFTDDDCRPRPGWVEVIASGVEATPPRAVGGSTLNGLPGNPYDDAAQLVLDLLSRHDRDLAGRERLLPTNNIAFPAEAFRAMGGFDERFRTAEDRELCRRWSAAGYSLGRVQDAVVEHDAQLSITSFLRKFYAYGRGASRFHKTGGSPSLRESMGFHLRLPVLVMPELGRRSVARGAAIILLLALWEASNLVGFVVDRLGSRGAVKS